MPPINPTASTEFVPKPIEGKDRKKVADAMGKMVMDPAFEDTSSTSSLSGLSSIQQLQGLWTRVMESALMQEQEQAALGLALLLKDHGPQLLYRNVAYSSAPSPAPSPFNSSSSLSSLASSSAATTTTSSSSNGGGVTTTLTLLKGIQTALETAEGKSSSSIQARIRLGALLAVKAMCTEMGSGSWFESYAIALLRRILSSYKGAKAVVVIAEDTAKAIINITSSHGVRPVLQVIFDGMGAYEWQVKEGSIRLLGEVVTTICRAGRENIAKQLPDVILKLIDSLSDTRPTVKQAALHVFPQVCSVITNTDVDKIIPVVIQAYADPTKTEAALEAMSACSFIQVVDAPTLGLMLPILMRGMKERKALTKRTCGLIIGNMCKLVADPRDAAQFYPVLQPVLERALDEATNVDMKEACNRALTNLTAVRGALRELKNHEEEKRRLLPHLHHAVQRVWSGGGSSKYEEIYDYMCDVAVSLTEAGTTGRDAWSDALGPYLSAFLVAEKGKAAALAAGEHFFTFCITGIEAEEEEEEEEDELEDVVNTEFSLGYGGKILLHNTRLWLKRGRRYGIVGKNGCGKTTLMRNIANGSLDGLPEGLKTVYVESNPASDLTTPVAAFVVSQVEGITFAQATAKLAEFEFPHDLQVAPLSSLSGGWRMKLALAQAMLQDPDMLLLDEPTNHLDTNAVAWLKLYLKSLKRVTCLMVSHSTSFLDDVCTDIIHYEEQKLVPYVGNLSTFVARRPDAKHYYELSTETLRFNFPAPGRLDGVNSRTQTILKMEHVTFTYPGASRPQLIDVSLRLTRMSRVAVVGANGAGKSTLIKLLVGETVPDPDIGGGSGEVWKHHNLRVAYVAQHSFHHVEMHLEKSPVDYIKWRFHGGVDREILSKEALALTEAEELKLKSDRYGAVEELRNRRTRHGALEYEVKFVGMHERENKYFTKETLEGMGFANLVKQADERVAAEAAGLDLRPLITKVIQKHLDDFGLEQDFGTYGKIAGLSGGQKVKLVLAAAMWNQPHLLVLDEPTNFLDREALGAFATAIKEFQGGVIMISHDREFMQELCTETWLVENGEVDIVEEEMVEGKIVRKKKAKRVEEASDEAKLMNAGGNMNKAKEHTVEVDFWGKPLSKAEIRRRAKLAKAESKKK